MVILAAILFIEANETRFTSPASKKHSLWVCVRVCVSSIKSYEKN